VEIFWGFSNLGKIGANGLDPGEVESAFDALDWAAIPSEMEYRMVGEGITHTGKLIRVVYAETEDGPYPITAFPIRLQQRRTP